MLNTSLEHCYEAFARKDAAFCGTLFMAVRSTGIFCRIGCPARLPKKENVTFYGNAREALAAGYRPCLRCHPMEPPLAIPARMQQLLRFIDKAPHERISDSELRNRGYDPVNLRRWFRQHHGMTFQAYLRMRRINIALQSLVQGNTVTNAAFDHGYESVSGFRDAVQKITGQSAGKSKAQTIMQQLRIDTPLGPMLAISSELGLALLEFGDRRMLETQLQIVQKRYGGPILPGNNAILTQTQQELAEYFAGRCREFTIPLDVRGTAFQERVWRVLQTIPYGQTRSYLDQAKAIGNEKSVRAVAHANGENRIAIVIPCHRVIGHDGKLVGYGGGLERKRFLLALERQHSHPSQQTSLFG